MATPAIVRNVMDAVPHLRKTHVRHMSLDFDDEADVLYVSFERPQRATDTEEIEPGVLLRTRGRKVVGVTLLDVSKRKG